MKQLCIPSLYDATTFDGKPLRSGECKFCEEPVAAVCYYMDGREIVRFLCHYHGEQHDIARDYDRDRPIKLWNVHFI